MIQIRSHFICNGKKHHIFQSIPNICKRKSKRNLTGNLEQNPVDIQKYTNDIFCILTEYPLLYQENTEKSCVKIRKYKYPGFSGILIVRIYSLFLQIFQSNAGKWILVFSRILVRIWQYPDKNTTVFQAISRSENYK